MRCGLSPRGPGGAMDPEFFPGNARRRRFRVFFVQMITDPFQLSSGQCAKCVRLGFQLCYLASSGGCPFPSRSMAAFANSLEVSPLGAHSVSINARVPLGSTSAQLNHNCFEFGRKTSSEGFSEAKTK